MRIDQAVLGMKVRYMRKEYSPYGKIGTIVFIGNDDHTEIGLDFGRLFPLAMMEQGTKDDPWFTDISSVEPVTEPDSDGNYW